MTDMLQKSENVAKNVANENSQDLTSQWKNGELQEGWYWVKKKTCEEYIDKVYFWYDTFIDGDVPLDNDKVIEVLAKVPSYEELQNMNEAVNQAMAANIKLVEQNKQLKEVLKECVKMNTRLENALWQWNEESILYDENEALENKINEVLNA